MPKLRTENRIALEKKSLRNEIEIAPSFKVGIQSTAEPICQYSHARKGNKLRTAIRKYQPFALDGSARRSVPISVVGVDLVNGSNPAERQFSQRISPAISRIKSTRVMRQRDAMRNA